MKAKTIHVRWMVARDLPQVLAIEKLTAHEPWDQDEFYRRLRKRNCIGMVAERGDEIGGFFVYSLARDCMRLLRWAALDGSMCDATRGRIEHKRESHRRRYIKWTPCRVGTVIDRRWATEDVRLMSQGKRPCLPVLADALEEGGCDNRRLLDCFREDGPTARACFDSVKWILSEGAIAK